MQPRSFALRHKHHKDIKRWENRWYNNIEHNPLFMSNLRTNITDFNFPNHEGKNKATTLNPGVTWAFSCCFFVNIFAVFTFRFPAYFRGSLRNSSTPLLFQDISKIQTRRFNNVPDFPGSTSECLVAHNQAPDGVYHICIDDWAKPVLTKPAAFDFKYDAVTFESERKVRIFSPFPRIPEINLTQATNLVEVFKRAPNSICVMYINKNWKFMYFNEKFAPFSSNLKQELAF